MVVGNSSQGGSTGGGFVGLAAVKLGKSSIEDKFIDNSNS